jgi:hypothetical protein
MTYQVKSKEKRHAENSHSEFTSIFYVESKTKPDLGRIRQLVQKFTGGDFAEETIQLHQCPEIDAGELRKETVVYKLE